VLLYCPPLLKKADSKAKKLRQKNYCQIKAEIMKFMWVCVKCRFGQKIPLCLQNKEIVRFLLFLKFYDAWKWKINFTADQP
jgi:hypothetical protein